MPRYKGVFERYLEAAEHTGDIMLRLMYQKDMIKQSLFERQERERLVSDVAGEVLAHISATVDASEIFDAIDKLNDKIDDLGE